MLYLSKIMDICINIDKLPKERIIDAIILFIFSDKLIFIRLVSPLVISSSPFIRVDIKPSFNIMSHVILNIKIIQSIFNKLCIDLSIEFLIKYFIFISFFIIDFLFNFILLMIYINRTILDK